MPDRVIKKLYLITQDLSGHLHHYTSKKAMMHAEILIEFAIDLDNEKIIEKGFILGEHKITASFRIKDIKGNKDA